jgi:hypothetical protein
MQEKIKEMIDRTDSRMKRILGEGKMEKCPRCTHKVWTIKNFEMGILIGVHTDRTWQDTAMQRHKCRCGCEWPKLDKDKPLGEKVGKSE